MPPSLHVGPPFQPIELGSHAYGWQVQGHPMVTLSRRQTGPGQAIWATDWPCKWAFRTPHHQKISQGSQVPIPRDIPSSLDRPAMDWHPEPSPKATIARAPAGSPIPIQTLRFLEIKIASLLQATHRSIQRLPRQQTKAEFDLCLLTEARKCLELRSENTSCNLCGHYCNSTKP